jgi:DNA repair protein RecO (recombination protein O)
MRSTRDQAVCIRHWDWSETSQTVSLFTRASGVIRGIAKGAKREKAPFSGGIELLTRGEVVAIVKPSSELANITAWDLQETFPALRRSLAAFHSAMYVADLTRHALHDRDPHPVLFDALVSALRELDQVPPGLAILRYLWTTLVECGYRPELDRDVVSGSSLGHAKASGRGGGGEFSFAVTLGGFTTLQPPVGAPPGPVWRVRAETLQLLRDLAAGGSPAGASVDRAARLLNAYISAVLGREIPAAGPLFGPVPR